MIGYLYKIMILSISRYLWSNAMPDLQSHEHIGRNWIAEFDCSQKKIGELVPTLWSKSSTYTTTNLIECVFIC